jgi:RNA polymerase II elongation factor ELL
MSASSVPNAIVRGAFYHLSAWTRGLSKAPAKSEYTTGTELIHFANCPRHNQTLQYGSKTQHLSTSTDPFPHELFRSHSSNSQADSSPPTTPAMKANEITHHKSTIRVETAPHPQFLAMFAPTRFTVTKKGASIAGRSNMTSKPRLAGSTGAVDAAVAALQNSLASENAKKAENT